MEIKSGIYKITNITSGIVYIGSTNNFKKRFTQHKSKLNKNKHDNYKLQNVWNEYGENDFTFEVIEHVEDLNLLLDREQFYVDEYRKIGDVCNISEPEEEFRKKTENKKVLNKAKLQHKFVPYVRLIESLFEEKKNLIIEHIEARKFYNKVKIDEYFIKGIMGDEDQLLNDDRIYKVLHRLYNKCGLTVVSGIKYKKELSKLGIKCEVRGDILVSDETNHKLYNLRFKNKIS